MCIAALDQSTGIKVSSSDVVFCIVVLVFNCDQKALNRVPTKLSAGHPILGACQIVSS